MTALNFSNYPQEPHGGTLVNQVLTGAEKEQEYERAKTLPSIRVDLEAIITLEMIAIGVLSPNKGFMNEKDYKSVLKDGRLANGLIWPVPLSFAPIGKRNSEIIETLSVGDEVSLIDSENKPVAILKLEDIFEYDKDERASSLFNTTDRNHPGVDSIYRRMGDTALGGQSNYYAVSIGDHLRSYVLNRKIHVAAFMKIRNSARQLVSSLVRTHYTVVMNISIVMH